MKRTAWPPLIRIVSVVKLPGTVICTRLPDAARFTTVISVPFWNTPDVALEAVGVSVTAETVVLFALT